MTLGIVLVLTALATNTFVSYRATSALAKSNQLVAHTLQVIDELDVILSEIARAESSQRGYLLARNPAYLETFHQAATGVLTHIDRLSELTKDNPDQRSHIPELRRLVEERLAIAQRKIDLERTGNHAEAMRLAYADLGKQTMDQIHSLITDMHDREDQLLDRRTEASRWSLRAANTTFLLASLTALTFLLAFFLVVRRELEERARAAEAVRDREAWLQTTLHSIGDAVIATNEKGEVKFINAVSERLLQYTSSDVEGKPLSQVFTILDENTRVPALNPVATVLRSGATTGLATHTVLRNWKGEEIPIEDSAAPILDSDGKLHGVVLVFRDVTEQRAAQESARIAERMATAGRLAATVAHEINNPLEAATNLLFLARTGTSLEETKRYIVEAEQELSRMAHVTRKTLAFYRSPAAPAPTNVCTLLEDVLRLYEDRIHSKGIKTEIKCPRGVEIPMVRGDLTQIASNLISNAIDAVSQSGRLEIKATVDDRGTLLEIEDDGSGIPRENLEKVFQPFFTTKPNTGTGLGLWVVKDLVEKQGGTISVTSPTRDRCGTRFSVFLPTPGVETKRSEVRAS